MGSSSVSQWKPPSDLYIVMDYKYCKVWIRKTDKFQHLEQYPVEIQNQQEFQLYQQMFALRLQQPYFPTTLYFSNQASKPLCGAYKMGSILIQRIPYRLCQFINISYNQAISSLYYCLKGYQVLYKRQGLFKIKSTMIGLDQNYKIKIWHHTDLSSIYPQDKYCHTVCQMVGTIVRSIENVSAFPYHGCRFTQFVEKKKIILFGFQIALKMLEEYANYYRIRIENKFVNIQNYLKQAQGITKFAGHKGTARSLQKSQASLIQRSKNRSLGKFSFKNNKIIEIPQDKQFIQPNPINHVNNIYYNNSNSNISPRYSGYQSATSIVQNQITFKASQQTAPTYNQQPQPRLNILQTKYLNNSKKDSFSSFDDYGLQQQLNKKPQHLRAASKLQKIAKQSQAIRQFTHGRAASDFHKVNQVQVQTLKPISPYYQATQTNTNEDSRIKQIHNFIPIQSYSFTVDQFSRQKNNIVNFKKNR